ncbi:MAG: hypothetical protein RLZZ471_1183 [Actinomycetota bacterium]|jgi:hypothetical protein
MGDWLSNAASVVTILGFIALIVQQVRQSRASEDEIRAYLHVDIRKVKSTKGIDMVELILYNSGRVPAEKVRLEVDESIVWFSLNGSRPPEIAKSDSSLRVLPGEELSFLLGPLKNLSQLRDSSVQANLIYTSIPRKKDEVRELQSLSLLEKRYLVSRKIH